jgi:hypothetical protein
MSGFYYLAHQTEHPNFGTLEGRCIHFNRLLSDPPLDASCIFIEAIEDASALAVVESIRGRAYPCLYPVPVILTGELSFLSERLILAADYALSPKETAGSLPDSLRKFIEECSRRIERLPDKEKPLDTNIAFKIIRHAYVRNAKMIPHRCIWNMHGWVHPQLLPYTGYSADDFMQLFGFMESQGIVTSEFHSKAFSCSQCQCAFLNFRETCPHCGSINLKLADIVHHFPCAYIGPMDDFMQDGGLICPKCDKELRHIGVDYDKPSAVYSCRECAHNCQDPTVSTECFYCGRVSDPEGLNINTVNIYSLTSLGNNAAIHGIDSLLSVKIGEKLHAVTMDIFKKILHLEIKRIKRYKKSESTLIHINICYADNLILNMSGKSSALLNELSAIILSDLRGSDVLTLVNSSFFLILLIETSVSSSEHVIRKIKDGISSLLASNLKIPGSVQGGCLPVTGEEQADEMIAKAAENVSG